MRIQDLSGKRVCILGFGKEGRAAASAIEKAAKDVRIVIGDQSTTVEIPEHYEKSLGEAWLTPMESADVIVKSPGIPPLPEFKKFRKKMTTPTAIFFDSVEGSGALLIGITGSKGKSTTSALIHAILLAAGKQSLLVGNIGEPSIAHINDASKDTIFVIEMSSYQLMDMYVSPEIAVITAFFPEHLDYHGSLDAYLDAKKNISRFQSSKGISFYNEEFSHAHEIALLTEGRAVPYSASDLPLQASELLLRGVHNIANAAGALSVARYLKIPDVISLAAIKAFKGLPHRLETVAETHGIKWINDSISTTPETAVAALNALDGKVATIILGGQDRGYDFSILARRLLVSNVTTVIVLPESGSTIEKEIRKTSFAGTLQKAADMKEAVALAKAHTKSGIVLLSPASPSYGHFKNFEDRGNQFRALAAS